MVQHAYTQVRELGALGRQKTGQGCIRDAVQKRLNGSQIGYCLGWRLSETKEHCVRQGSQSHPQQESQFDVAFAILLWSPVYYISEQLSNHLHNKCIGSSFTLSINILITPASTALRAWKIIPCFASCTFILSCGLCSHMMYQTKISLYKALFVYVCVCVCLSVHSQLKNG